MIHLAIDIGASSGRHIAAWREDGELKMKEVYRFSNLPDERDGHLVWDLDRLCREVVSGLKACKEQGIVPDSVGIDTWAVDYVLLDDQDRPILPLYCYRDSRGAEGAELAHKAVPFDRLYERTGIQFQPFNTIYQLCWDKAHGRLDNAADFLMLPEYLSFYLSGVKAHEYTNASSTGLLDAKGRTWDMEIVSALGEEARAIRREDEEMCQKIAEHGLSLLKPGDGVLTHCNAGPLATSKYGTALGPILLGHERGIPLKVFADETRPLLQGARLTAWELQQAGVDVTLICDNMVSMVMKNGSIQACFVGCDRVAANGDAANKIGTSGVAILARHYGIPFYVLGPTSTIDMRCPSGDAITIEERPSEEITEMWYP